MPLKKKQPSIFILENVKNFKFIEKGKPFNFLIDELASIVNEDGEQLYNIYCDIYNTKDYGIPQNRERIYIIGIKSDILCPLEEQRFMAAHLPGAQLVEIDSTYGHDGFIIETAQITTHLKAWLGSLI